MEKKMKLNTELQPYFKKHAPSTEYHKLTVRTINALVRSGIETMDKLCSTTEEDLMRVRNLGTKCFEMTMYMRKKYESEME